MLDAAFGFRKTEAWKELNDANIFAVRLSNGKTVYCSIMGNGGEHHSLGIYILSLIHISEPTRHVTLSRMPSSA